jgi:hypothetical protein
MKNSVKNSMKNDPEEKKDYIKPEIQKHKAAATVSGSGDDDPCLYKSKNFVTTYYH